MANKGRSEPGLFGTINHYDEHGKKIGTSEPNLFGGYTNYDAHGRKTGTSEPEMFGGYTNYDAQGKKIGSTQPGMFGEYTNYDADGKKTGSSTPGAFGTYHHSDSQGCYVATCVYGSYDCPEVWTLRRFRDDTLARSAAGRAFIRAYYAVSPALVRRFGTATWFRGIWKSVLDKLVRRLRANGVEDTPYRDRPWR